jgi:hypothetical protein
MKVLTTLDLFKKTSLVLHEGIKHSYLVFYTMYFNFRTFLCLCLK